MVLRQHGGQFLTHLNDQITLFIVYTLKVTVRFHAISLCGCVQIWRFDPKFQGEMAGACEAALGYEMFLGGVKTGTFRLVAQLFYWSKYIE